MFRGNISSNPLKDFTQNKIKAETSNKTNIEMAEQDQKPALPNTSSEDRKVVSNPFNKEDHL